MIQMRYLGVTQDKTNKVYLDIPDMKLAWFRKSLLN